MCPTLTWMKCKLRKYSTLTLFTLRNSRLFGRRSVDFKTFYDAFTYMGHMDPSTVYPKKFAHGFVVLCFVVVMQSFMMNSHEVFIHIHQGCFAGTGAIVRLPQCQWSKPDGYRKISPCITTTKHSKAKTVCIFLGIYCITTVFLSAVMNWLKIMHRILCCRTSIVEYIKFFLIFIYIYAELDLYWIDFKC